MAVEVRKRQGELTSALVYRFTKRIKHGGVLTELKKRRFYKRTENRNKRKKSALYKTEKREAVRRARKLGTI